jgi:hypothetical protein
MKKHKTLFRVSYGGSLNGRFSQKRLFVGFVLDVVFWSTASFARLRLVQAS